jgi:hypothetical protein
VQSTAQPTSTGSLITSKIILDDVGRGSNGGDLVVGGLSVGDDTDNGTSNSTGVEEFDITVERSSILGNINSTNNTLREVFIENGTTKGDLTVNGDRSGTANENTNDLPGDLAQDNAFGFSDVRILDASTMVGKVNLTAELTDNIVAKYMDRKDTANDPAQDNSTFNPQNTQGKEFVYTLGTNSDTLSMNISKSNAAATGTTSREDFELTIHGGTGDDAITTIIGDGEGTSNDHWYINSKQNSNLNINGDAGNDTITTSGAGDVVINAGDGNDTVYTDNTGAQKAIWVLNTDGDNDDATANGSVAPTLDDDTLNNAINNVETDGVTAVLLHKGQLQVTFRHLNSTKVTVASDASTFKTSALQVNQAIKTAINGDAVLSKLIVAEDGPSETLVVTSLIDGQTFSVNDLTVAITAPTAVSTTDLEAINKTLPTAGQLTAATVLTTMATNATTLDNAYLSEFARDDADAVIDGLDSDSTNDNTITGGAGNDVIVLSTDSNDSSQETLVLSGNFGADTVLNHNTANDAKVMDNGADVINLNAYKSGTTDFTISADQVLSANNEIIFTTFTDGAKDAAGVVISHQGQAELAVSATASSALSGVVFARNTADNVVEIYTAAAANDTVADAVLTFKGSIDFADVSINDFNNINNFLGAVDAGGGAVAPVAAPVAGKGDEAAITTSAGTVDAALARTTYNVDDIAHNQTIQNFTNDDVLNFDLTKNAPQIATTGNDVFNDGIVVLSWAGNALVTITLTGLSAADDGTLSTGTIATFDTVFGTGTII